MADKFNLLLQMGLEERLDSIGPDDDGDLPGPETRDEFRMEGYSCQMGNHAHTCQMGNHAHNYLRERYAYACALFFYNNDTEFRNITHNIKYQGNQEAGLYFGRLLGQHLAESAHLEDIDLVIPVPLHWKREWKRGYNQAESIARGISLETGAVLDCDILHRTRYTSTQTRLEVSEKQKNVKEAFAVTDDGALSILIEKGGGHILLVDDVFTSYNSNIRIGTKERWLVCYINM